MFCFKPCVKPLLSAIINIQQSKAAWLSVEWELDLMRLCQCDGCVSLAAVTDTVEL